MNEALTNKRRLAFQMLDREAQRALRAALIASAEAILAQQAQEPRRQALARIRGAVAFDAGAWVRRQQNKALASISGLLEALG